MKKLMMIQPGAFGDIIVCAPIAKAYSDAGYDVYWPVRKQFLDMVSRLGYVTPCLIDEEVLDDDWLRSDVIKCVRMYEEECFDYALNLADRGPHPTAQRNNETFEQTKYRLVNIPFNEKYNFVWNRNKTKEEELYDKILDNHNLERGDNYILAHVKTSESSLDAGVFVNLPEDVCEKMPIIYVEEISDYSVFDWYSVLSHATEIYCIESLIHCFIDGCLGNDKIKNIPKYLLPRPSLASSGVLKYTVSEHWSLDYMAA